MMMENHKWLILNNEQFENIYDVKHNIHVMLDKSFFPCSVSTVMAQGGCLTCRVSVFKGNGNVVPTQRYETCVNINDGHLS